MTLEQQGAYRNLLDELWLRDGFLVDDEDSLASASKAGRRWPFLAPVVLAQFTKVEDGYRHAVHDKVAKESKRRARKQARYRASRADRGGNVTGNVRRSLSLQQNSGSGRASTDPNEETGPERTGWLEGIGAEPGPRPAPTGHDPRTCADPLCCLDAWNRAKDAKLARA